MIKKSDKTSLVILAIFAFITIVAIALFITNIAAALEEESSTEAADIPTTEATTEEEPGGKPANAEKITIYEPTWLKPGTYTIKININAGYQPFGFDYWDITDEEEGTLIDDDLSEIIFDSTSGDYTLSRQATFTQEGKYWVSIGFTSGTSPTVRSTNWITISNDPPPSPTPDPTPTNPTTIAATGDSTYLLVALLLTTIGTCLIVIKLRRISIYS